MFKRIGCLFKFAGCLVFVIIITGAMYFGSRYLVRSLQSSLEFPVKGESITYVEAETGYKLLIDRTTKNILNNKKDRLSVRIDEKDMAVLILKSWNETRRIIKVYRKEFTIPKMRVTRCWVEISESGFDTILQLQLEQSSAKPGKSYFLRIFTEIFTRNGKLFPKIIKVRLGKTALPDIIASPFRNHIENIFYTMLNSYDLWKGGKLSGLELLNGEIVIYWAPPTPEREINM